MLKIFRRSPAWRWNDEGDDDVLPAKTAKAQASALLSPSTTAELKLQILQHITQLASPDAKNHPVLLQHGVLQACVSILGPANEEKVQAQALLTLDAACHASPETADAIIAQSPGLITALNSNIQQWKKSMPLTHASLALLQALLSAATVASTLQHHGSVRTLITFITSVSKEAIKQEAKPQSSGTAEPAQSQAHLQLLVRAVSVLCLVAATGDHSAARDVGKYHGIKVLIGLVQDHSSHTDLLEAVVGTLAMLTCSDNNKRVSLLEEDGLVKLLELLKDASLTWNVKQYVCQTLHNVCCSPGCCQAFTASQGVDVVMSCLESAVDSPPSADRMLAVEELLAVLRAVSSDTSQCHTLADAAKLRLLMQVFRLGMQNFKGGSHRIAVGVGEVLQQLATQPSLAKVLCRQEVVGPVAMLVERGSDYSGCDSPKHAAIVHGAWCALGMLSEVAMAGDKGGGARSITEAMPANALRAAVSLLCSTAPVLRWVFGGPAVQQPSDQGEDPLEHAMEGLLYLQCDRVQQSLRCATRSLLQVLNKLVGDDTVRGELSDMQGLVEGIQQLASCQHLQWSSKHFLHQLGHVDSEYQPLVKYNEELLKQLLVQQGIMPEPFLVRRIDAHIFMTLPDDYMRGSMQLDEVQVLKVRRIQSAHTMFNAMDAVDGRIDGMVKQDEMARYLQNQGNLRVSSADDLTRRVWRELHVQSEEPVCFLQFARTYPWLSIELEAFQGNGISAGSPSRGAKRAKIEMP